MGFSRLALKLDSQNSFGDEHTATVRALSYCCLYLFFRVHSKPVEHEHEKLPKVKALVGSIPDGTAAKSENLRWSVEDFMY